jgi:hypothetical protein
VVDFIVPSIILRTYAFFGKLRTGRCSLIVFERFASQQGNLRSDDYEI